ncbi:hypothetical protein J6590_081063 [Homalodisca vitripennis]|nr:hypothetical protein J6590_081063 [Homalodisca vitripennis]
MRVISSNDLWIRSATGALITECNLMRENVWRFPSRCEVVKDLGVLLNDTLTPDHDIEAICSGASKLLGFLW